MRHAGESLGALSRLYQRNAAGQSALPILIEAGVFQRRLVGRLVDDETRIVHRDRLNRLARAWRELDLLVRGCKDAARNFAIRLLAFQMQSFRNDGEAALGAQLLDLRPRD